MKRPKIKICGITTVEQAIEISHLNIDAIGFVLFPPSPRFIKLEKVKSIVASLPPYVTTVGVVVNEPINTIKEMFSKTGLELIQLSGEESPEYCQSLTDLGIKWIKTFRIKKEFDFNILKEFPSKYFLFDAWSKKEYGGTGKSFDWKILNKNLSDYHIILAGGINEQNVVDAIKTAQPYGIDLSSGVEVKPGVKSINKIKKLIGTIDKFVNQTAV